MPASNATPRARWSQTASTRWSRRSAGKLRAHLDANNTFRAVAEERAEVTLSKVRWLLEKVYPFLGDLPIHGIEVQEVLAVLGKIEATRRDEGQRDADQRDVRKERYGNLDRIGLRVDRWPA